MKHVPCSERRSLVHPLTPGFESKVLKMDSMSGKIYLGVYEPIDQKKFSASMYELDASLKAGRNLDPVAPVDYSSFDARISAVESTLNNLAAKSSKIANSDNSDNSVNS